jgi:predicted ArsR family transcriptional regulator
MGAEDAVYEVNPDLLAIGKALGEETRFSIFRRIASSEKPQTVKDLVAAFSMHHSAIRIHLNKLEDAGLIVARKHHRKGAVGRPELAFLPSPHTLSITLPPRNYEFLARVAMDLAASHNGGDGAIEEFGFAWGKSYMTERAGNGPVPLYEALHIVRDTAASLGASPQLAEEPDGAMSLTESNCVFSELAGEYEPSVCVLHQAVMQGMLAGLGCEPFDWESVTTLASGADACYVRVRPRVD